MSAIDEIKSRLDIVQYIQQYVPLKKQGRTHKACCPFHNEKTPSFVVNEDRQSWRCFGSCAEGGDIFKFAMKVNGWSFSEALEELGKRAGVEVHKQSPEQREKADEYDRLRGLMKSAADYFHDHLVNTQHRDAAAVLEYARKKRGLTDDTLTRFQLGFAPEGWRNLLDNLLLMGYSHDDLIAVGLAKRNDKGDVYDTFRNRFMIPIRDERGRVVGFGARALAPDDNPKYLNSPQTVLFDKSRLLFGLDFAKEAIRASGTVVIVEGYLDVIQAHQAGYSNVVAQMGTSLTEPQLQLLVPRLAKKVIMALDSDTAGQNATRRSLEVAREVLQADYGGRLSADIRVLHIPDAKDPDDLIRETPDQWTGLVDAAMPVANFVIDMELATLPDNPSVQEREVVARKLLPILLATEDGLYQNANLQHLALRLKVDEKRLMIWASDISAIHQASMAQKPLTPSAPTRKPSSESDVPPLDSDFDPHPLSFSAPLAVEIPDIPAEVFCLKTLLTHPSMLFDINRKLRELANDDEQLTNGVLAEFSPDDFTRDTNRALMSAFLESMAQDELPPLEHLSATLPDILYDAAQRVLQDTWDQIRPKLRMGMGADLTDWLQRHGEKGGLDELRTALLEATLRMRANKLQREREEFSYLRPDDEFDEKQISAYIALSLKAKQQIDAELHRRSRVIRA